eukprot:gene14672-22446_t
MREGSVQTLANLLQTQTEQKRLSDDRLAEYRQHLTAYHDGTLPTIGRRIWSDGTTVLTVTAFSWRQSDAWQRQFASNRLSPCHPLVPFEVEVTVGGVTAAFKTIAAAYHAIRWWDSPGIRRSFEAARNQEEVESALSSADRTGVPGCSAFDEWRSMLTVLLSCYRQIPEARAWLRSTAPAFLLCCDGGTVASADAFWTDGVGQGRNYLGLALMHVRDLLHLDNALLDPMAAPVVPAVANRSSTTWPYGVTAENWQHCITELAYFCRLKTYDG